MTKKTEMITIESMASKTEGEAFTPVRRECWPKTGQCVHRKAASEYLRDTKMFYTMLL